MLPVLAYIKASGMSEAKFAKTVLNIDQANLTNWKQRGVPQGKMQSKIAAIIGKSTDQYLAEIGRPTGAEETAPLKPDEKIMLERYRSASPRWRAALRDLATLHADEQDEVAESVNVLYAQISAKHAADKRVEDRYGRPPPPVDPNKK